MVLRNQFGQTVVEYILLLAVSVSLITTFYNSDTFQNLFGSQGSVGKLYKWESEWGYRHAFTEGKDQGDQIPIINSAENHPSYFSQSRGQTRFFGASDPYGQ